MAKYARHVWYTIRGTILAVLGVTAAYALSLLLDQHGAGFGWQAGLGLAAFLTTVLAVGRYAFRMHPADTVEETADALRAFAITFGRVALIALLFFAALVSSGPRYV
ncbi:hypothetical protein [Streptomyces sp. NPDC047868]|uniref:hypothetical protein n=1 Tax=Streptomyces sp. NPDC047868 TaxID=3155480 RepID=UPI003454B604